MGGKLDFLVIGAQRSGTTSLWRHLSDHPELYLAPAKEVPFFSRNERYARGMESYLHAQFKDAPPNARWGTVSPQYMSGSRHAAVDVIARRIHEAVPGVRLVCILREPIARAFSAYRMMVARGDERRTFEDAMREQLKRWQAATRLGSRSGVSSGKGVGETDTYLTVGNYGHTLATYLSYFSRDQLLVTFTRDLASDPTRTLETIFEFLRVSVEHRPPDLERRHHRGGFEQRLSKQAERELRRYVFGILSLVPERERNKQRRAFEWWFREWNTVADDAEVRVPLSPETRARLEEHYRSDGELLAAATGIAPPWTET